jgi:glycosyltransferase involved in cell wall biosynthesis
MDGLEWVRSKYSKPVRRFLKYAEKLAANNADWLVADSIPISEYLLENFTKPVKFIAYGADIPQNLSEKIIRSFGLKKRAYDLVVARIIPDNHIEMILQAKELATDQTPLFILCNENAFKKYLAKKYSHLSHVIFYGPVYEKEKVNSLRHYCRYYLHGHSAGGTNPSLLEAMACSSPVVAHGNKFNRAVLGEDAQFFSSSEELRKVFEQFNEGRVQQQIENNLLKINTKYNWELVSNAYEQLFYEAIHSR